MKLTILVDNNTFIDRYFYGEPAAAYYIEADGINILFDAGYSDAFIKNALKMNISLNNLNSIVISHGHIDHTGGLYDLIKLYSEGKLEGQNPNKPNLIAHPDAFMYKHSKGEEIGSVISEEKLRGHFNMVLSKEPVWITDNLVFLGEIERSNDFENKIPIGKVKFEGKETDDYILDDSALVYRSTKGLVIITGCSHSGICNIIEYAKKIMGDDRIVDIIGGFHLQSPSEELLKKTCEYIEKCNIDQLHAGHCTDLKSKLALGRIANLKELGVALELEY